MCIVLAVDIEVHRTPAVWAVEGACAYVLSHVEHSAFEVVAHHPFEVFGGELLRGLYPQREGLAFAIEDPGGVGVHLFGGGEAAEVAPYSGVAPAGGAYIGYCVGTREVEVFDSTSTGSLAER